MGDGPAGGGIDGHDHCAEARGGEFEKAVGCLREALQLSREAPDPS